MSTKAELYLSLSTQTCKHMQCDRIVPLPFTELYLFAPNKLSNSNCNSLIRILHDQKDYKQN